MFKGQNVANITKVKRADVFIDVFQTVVGKVNIPQSVLDVDGALSLATVLSSTDGGITWNPLTTPAYESKAYSADEEVYYKGHIFKSKVVDNNTIPDEGDWDDLGEWNANGVLYNDLTESKKTTVVVTATVKEKYLCDYDVHMKATLFKNKIIAK